MKIIVIVLLVLTGTLSLMLGSSPLTGIKNKDSIDLKCEQGIVTYYWYKASLVSDTTYIKYPQYLRSSGTYKNDDGSVLKCIN